MIRQSELLKRLQNSTKDDNREMNNNASDFDNEALITRLRFQGSLENRKRASDDSDDSSPRPKLRLSVLQEKNKMLAALLALPPSHPNNRLMMKEAPAVRQMPDIPNLVRQLNSPPLGTAAQCENDTPNTAKVSTKATNQKRNQSGGMSKNVQRSNDGNFPMDQQQRIAASPMSAANLALNQLLVASQANQGTFDVNQFVSSTPDITSAPASSSTAQPDIDPELSDLLENFIEFEPSSGYDDALQNNFQQLSANAEALKQQLEIAEINKIQQSLMECEKEDNFSTGSPPAYPIHAAISQQNRIQTFNQPPPGYNTQRGPPAARLQLQNNTNNSSIVSNSNSPTVAQATNSQQITKPVTPQQLLLQRQQLLQQQRLQEQQKQRLLQQQQNQQFLMNDQSCEF